MTELTDTLLTAMTTVGPAALSLALLMGALGVPLPGTLFLLAAGALARAGGMDGALAMTMALLGVLIGDSAGYVLGLSGQRLLLRRFEGGATWRQAQGRFQQWGGATIFLTRFLLTPLAVPTNLIAGSSRYTYWRFLAFDAAGELAWVVLYGGLGYFFGGGASLLT